MTRAETNCETIVAERGACFLMTGTASALIGEKLLPQAKVMLPQARKVALNALDDVFQHRARLCINADLMLHLFVLDDERV
jgi:hypothetical protein